MAKPMLCQICNSGTEAAFLLTNLNEGVTRYICILCAAPHFANLAAQVADFLKALSGEADQEATQETPSADPNPAPQAQAENWPHTQKTVRGAAHARKRAHVTAQEVRDNQAEQEPFGAPEE